MATDSGGTGAAILFLPTKVRLGVEGFGLIWKNPD